MRVREERIKNRIRPHYGYDINVCFIDQKNQACGAKWRWPSIVRKINDNWPITCMRSKSFDNREREKQMIHFDNLNGSTSTLPTNQTNLTEVMCGYVEGEEDNKLFSDQRESE